MQVEVTVPSLLSDCTNNQACFFLEAGTLEEALQRLLQTYPLLRIHLYDEQERLRPHVLIYYNDESIAWLERLDLPLQPRDRLHVLQAVSGG
jgi:molybdopterin synthase sulfur carrier subunit